MKKILPTLSLVLITFLFNSCSTDLDNNEDAAQIQSIQGKWKLTESYADDQPVNTPIVNGYEIEFKSDKTFTSNEENGFTGGTYTILKTPKNNLRLVYKKNWDAKVVYKYINQVNAVNINIEASNPEPTPEGTNYLSGLILTRIP